jgi:lipopolysaccharide export system protein LptC
MIARLIFLVLALIALGVLLYVQQPESPTPGSSATQSTRGEPGFVAIGAEIVETGDDGQPLYRLQADRIAQPVPQGTIYLTDPVLHYQPPGASPWVLKAQQGQLPQNAHTADLSGAVQADGRPTGSAQSVRLTTDTLHVDMQQQLATTPSIVHMQWAGSRLSGRGMRANLKSGRIDLLGDVSGTMAR